MEVIPIEIFGVHVEVPFPAPQPIKAAELDEFSIRICDPQAGLSTRPDQVRLKKWDDLFGYELSATFFGDNGQLTRTSERAKLFVRNARTQGDWNIIQQTLGKFYAIMDFPGETLTTLATHAHAKFASTADRDEYLNQFSHNVLLTKAAALGYVRIFDWEKDIRVLIEPSNLVNDAVFVAWETQFSNEQNEWDAFLASLPQMMENSVNLFELGFEPLKERV